MIKSYELDTNKLIEGNIHNARIVHIFMYCIIYMIHK